MAASTSSSPPASPAPAPAAAPGKSPLMGGCLSCRLLSGAGLLGAGGYVYWTARRPLKLGYAPSPGIIFQMVVGIRLLGAGGYVYWTARRPLKLGYAPSPGIIFQMVVGISIACWGLVILVDPVGKAYPIESKKQ